MYITTCIMFPPKSSRSDKQINHTDEDLTTIKPTLKGTSI